MIFPGSMLVEGVANKARVCLSRHLLGPMLTQTRKGESILTFVYVPHFESPRKWMVVVWAPPLNRF